MRVTLVRYYGRLLLTYTSRCAVHPAVAVPYSIRFLLFTGALLRQTPTLAVRAVARTAQPALYIILDSLAGALLRQTLAVAVRAAALRAQPALYIIPYTHPILYLIPSHKCFIIYTPRRHAASAESHFTHASRRVQSRLCTLHPILTPYAGALLRLTLTLPRRDAALCA